MIFQLCQPSVKQRIKCIALLLLLTLVTSTGAYAQSCACVDSFDEVVETYEKNYSLFKFKVNSSNQEVYSAYTQLMRDKAKATESQFCKAVLDQWLLFFRDEHNFIIESNQAAPAKAYETYQLEEQTFKARYRSPRKRKNDLIGIWESGSYRVAIVPEPQPKRTNRDYIAVVLKSDIESWKPNEVKFELQQEYGNDFKANFFMGDHSLKKVAVKLQNESLLAFNGLNQWHKVWPETATKQPAESSTKKAKGFHFEMLQGSIPYFRIPFFYPEHKVLIDSILNKHHVQIINAEMLVIDVIENGGGSDYVYESLMPYILTGPIQMPRSGIYLSEFNKASLIEQWGGLPDLDSIQGEELAFYKKFIEHNDTLMFFSNEKYYTYAPDTVYSHPKKVAILTGRGTGSSGETFVLKAKQSPRVVVYGQNTRGMIDGFGGTYKKLSCYTARFPNGVRSFDVEAKPIDPYGIAPHVYLDPSVNVLDFALKHMQLMNAK